MKYSFIVKGVLSVLFLMAARSAIAQVLSPQELFRRVSPSVVVIDVRDDDDEQVASGSGVVVGPWSGDPKKGMKVATNCHVVEDAPKGVVSFVGGGKYWGIGRVEGRDEARDVCIINAAIFDMDFKPLLLPAAQLGSSGSLQVGDPVYAIGAPQGLESTLSSGLVSGFREYEEGRYIQTTAPISPGSSGGGLFDAQGRLVGITTMFIKEGQALNFAVPAELIALIPNVSDVVDSVSADKGAPYVRLVVARIGSTPGAHLRGRSGAIRTAVQEQGGGAFAAAGECGNQQRRPRSRGVGGHAGALVQPGLGRAAA